jgi:hypothetical protein
MTKLDAFAIVIGVIVGFGIAPIVLRAPDDLRNSIVAVMSAVTFTVLAGSVLRGIQHWQRMRKTSDPAPPAI